MKCKNHPTREAENFCRSCGVPICAACTEEVNPREYYCFQCAMFQTVSGAGTSIKDRREKTAEKKIEKRGMKWGPFRYFVITSSVLILVMWGVILFGGKKAPGGAVDFSREPRVLLFMIDSAIKRYARYEGNKYPATLADVVPRYLSFKEEELRHLNRLSYQRDAELGYRLSFVNPEPGGMNLIITAKGIKY